MSSYEPEIRAEMRRIAKTSPKPSEAVAKYNQASDSLSRALKCGGDTGNYYYIRREAWRRLAKAMGVNI